MLRGRCAVGGESATAEISFHASPDPTSRRWAGVKRKIAEEEILNQNGHLQMVSNQNVLRWLAQGARQ
jgi:hypothetical protein